MAPTQHFTGQKHGNSNYLYTYKTNICLSVCILYNQRGATYTMVFIIISALHVSGGFSTHHQELIKLYVQP